MADGAGPDREHLEGTEGTLSEEQLEAFEYGWAATIMPAREGWRVQYFSMEDFEGEPGDVFATFEDAIAAISEVLPVVNSEEERARARRELRARRAGRQGRDGSSEGSGDC
jgi:hypothetical protein